MTSQIVQKSVISIVLTISALGCVPPNLLFREREASTVLASQEEDVKAKQFTVVPGTAVLYVFRDIPREGTSTKMVISIDQKEIAGTIPETFIRVELTPGHHEVLCRTENDESVALQVEPGKLYFIRQEFRMGWRSGRSKLLLVPDSTGRAGVMKCRMVHNGL